MRAWGLPLLLLLIIQPVTAQEPPPVPDPDASGIYAFSLVAPETTIHLLAGETVLVPMTFRDHSKDSATGATGTPVPGGHVASHQTTFEIRYLTEDTRGWGITTPAPTRTIGGEEADASFFVSIQPNIFEFAMEFEVVATTSYAGGRDTTAVRFTAITPGLESFNVQANGGFDLAPDEIVNVPVRITNAGLLPRAFDMEITRNTCGLSVATSNNNLVPGKTTKEYFVGLRGPTDKFWYNSELCTIDIQVYPTDNTVQTQTVSLSPQVNGVYVNPDHVFTGINLAVIAAIIILFLAARKRRLEEEILGKPQKPWTIPVEKVYLDYLKEKDERAWYLLRHHIMEEEYRSALDWFHAYKKATKGERTKERVVLGLEHKVERFDQKWDRKIRRPSEKADRFEARMQKRLDRRIAKKGKAQHKKWEDKVTKIEAAHDRRVARAERRHEALSRKAAKKGLDAPRLELPADPALPEEPAQTKMDVMDHRWGKKVRRRHEKAESKQERLEAKYDKARGRYLAKMRRKASRVARRIDDQSFIEEHTLLMPQS